MSLLDNILKHNKEIIKEVLRSDKELYRVEIVGVSDKMPKGFLYTTASSEEKAIANIVRKIMREVQRDGSVHNKGWKYRGNGDVSIPMTPQYAALLTSYLLSNREFVKVQKMLRKHK